MAIMVMAIKREVSYLVNVVLKPNAVVREKEESAAAKRESATAKVGSAAAIVADDLSPSLLLNIYDCI